MRPTTNLPVTEKPRLGSQNYHYLPTRWNSDTLKVFVLLALTIWIAYFWHHADFGLNSDDFWRVGDSMKFTWPEFWRRFMAQFLLKEGEGRPFHDGLIYLFSFIGFRLGGLQVIYWLGYIVLTANSCLFYTLLKRLYNQPFFAVTGALSFCLFPAHTTQTWLTIAFGAQPSLTFFLLATHCYLSERRKFSYLFIFCSLLCYETVFPVFLAVPLLRQKKWNLELIRKLVRHVVILASMIAGIVILRKLTGEGRVVELDLMDAMKTSIRHMSIGPIVSMKTFLTRPLTTLRALVGKDSLKELWLFLPLCFAGLVWVLSQLKFGLPGKASRLKTAFESKVLRLEVTEFLDNLAKLALIGLIMLILAYSLTLIGFPDVINGRSSRIHLAAGVGASILCACVCSAVLFLANTYRRKRLATLGLATFFTLLVGFGLIVQQDYRLAWQYQRAYWSDVVNLIPDLDNRTVIFFEKTGVRQLPYMDAFSVPWLSEALSKIYLFPDNWNQQNAGKHPRPIWQSMYLLRKEWRETIVTDGNTFKLNPSVVGGAHYGRVVESSDVIFLEVKDGQLTRRTEPLIIGDKEFPLKEKTASGLPPFEKGPLYDYLIKSPDEEPINYVVPPE